MLALGIHPAARGPLSVALDPWPVARELCAIDRERERERVPVARGSRIMARGLWSAGGDGGPKNAALAPRSGLKLDFRQSISTKTARG